MKYMNHHGFDLSKPIHCLNPAHDDRHPSMSYFVDDGIPKLHCFGCNTSLDVFNCAHILHHKPISGPGFIDDTIVHVAEIVGVKLEMQQMSQEDIHRLTLYNLYKAVTEYIVRQPFNQLQINELDKRAWPPTHLPQLGIGCCNDLEAMREHLKNLGYGTKLLDDNEFSNNRLFSPNNLLFTLYDEYGKPNGFAGRNLVYDGVKDGNGLFLNGPKFINVKKSSIYSKKDSMYLFHLASKKTNNSMYIVEGYADAVTAHVAGFSNVCALSMLGISDSQLNMCKRHGIYDVVICLDNDEPGMAKAKDVLDNVLKTVHDLRIRFVFLPHKEVNADGSVVKLKIDPDEYIRDNGIDAFLNLPKVDPFTWRLNQYIEDGDEYDPESICLAMIPIVAAEPSSVKRDGMIKELAEFTSYNEKAIRDDIDKILNATEQKIRRAKDSIISELVQALTDNPIGAESVLASAIDKLNGVAKQYESSVFEVSTQVNKLLSIKQYQESEHGHVIHDFGPYFRSLKTAWGGDLKQKLILIGGVGNVGKTSTLVNLCWNIVQHNPNAMVVFSSIDDTAKELIPRIACYDMSCRLYNSDPDLFEAININKIATPYLYRDSFEYEALMEQREISYKKLFQYAEQDRLVILDAEDGRTLDYVRTVAKHYSSKYPDRDLFIFGDNFHLYGCDGFQDSRTKYKHMSGEFKNIAVTNNCTLVMNCEYRKIPNDRLPVNDDLGETVQLVYDSNFIGHLSSELHRNRDKTFEYHWASDGTKLPCVSMNAGKNKICSFKGTIVYKFWPDKAFYVEISEAEHKNLLEANKQLAFQSKEQEYGEED